MGNIRILVVYDGQWVQQRNMFKFNSRKSIPLCISTDSTYHELATVIYRALKLDPLEYKITMKFIYKAHVPVPPSEILCDEDVQFFLAENNSHSELRTPLCITVDRITSKDANLEIVADNVTHGDIIPSLCVRPNDLLELRDQDEGCADDGTADNDHVNDVPIVVDIADVGRAFDDANIDCDNACPTLNDNNQINPPAWNRFTMEDATSPLPNRRDSGNQSSSEEVDENRVYSGKNELKRLVGLMALRNNFQYKVKKSTKKLWVVVCTDKNCKWRIRASRVRDSECFKVKRFLRTHTCSSDTLKKDHRQASSSLVGYCLKSKYEGIGQKCKPKDIIEEVRREYGVNISYNKAWRARESVLGLPPRKKGSSERRRKERIPQNKEDKATRKCKRCGAHGHNRQTCKEPVSLNPEEEVSLNPEEEMQVTA